MLKVAKTLELDEATETNNAVIFGEELKLEQKEDNKCPRCEEEIIFYYLIERIF